MKLGCWYFDPLGRVVERARPVEAGLIGCELGEAGGIKFKSACERRAGKTEDQEDFMSVEMLE